MALWVFSHDDNFKFHGTLAQKGAYIAQNLLLMPGMFRLRAMECGHVEFEHEMSFTCFCLCCWR